MWSRGTWKLHLMRGLVSSANDLTWKPAWPASSVHFFTENRVGWGSKFQLGSAKAMVSGIRLVSLSLGKTPRRCFYLTPSDLSCSIDFETQSRPKFQNHLS